MKKSWRMIFAVVLCMLCLAPLALAEDGKTFVLPAKLKTVQAEAFAGDARVTKVLIPKTVNTIGARAFANCAGLREVYFENNSSLKIADDAFSGCGDICFYAYPDTPGEQFALSHGYQCEPLGSGSSFMERSLLLMSQHGGTTSILQSGEFDSKRLVVRMLNGRLPDVSTYKPVKVLRKEDGIYFVQFDTVENTANCYGYLKNLQKTSADVAFVECDSCVRAIDDVEAAGTVDSGVWDTEDPMGFDAYAPYVADNSSGKVVIAIIDSGVKKLAAYSGMLRSDGINLVTDGVTDGKDWSADNLVHGSMIAGIIHDCVGNNNVEILPIRVIADSNVVDCSMIALAIDYAVERGADIINLSMNFDENEYVRYAIGKAIDAGVRVIVAAGNNNQNIDKVFPANVPGVITVSGIDSQYTKSSSSNYGGNVTYCAPDTAVKSTAYPSMIRKGTSFAAPMVASALALAKLDSTHSESDIKTVCQQLTPVVNGVNNYGNGLIRLNQLISEGYTISYDANGGDNAPETQIKTPGISIILTEEKPTRHYKVTLNHGTGQIEEMSVNAPFIDWNTKANGSGTSYASGAKYKEDVAIKLYAQWDGAALTGLPTPTRTGYSFVGWYTASSGGNPVNAQTEITRNVNLYARWKELSAYTVAYDANGGTGAPANQTKYEGITLKLSATKPTRARTVTLDYGTGKKETRTISATFNSWNTNADGTGTKYVPGATYSANANATLYAQWTNGTVGTLPTPTRSGCEFVGWFTSSVGGSVVTASTAVAGDMTIYAQWNYTITYDANGGTGAPGNQTKHTGVDLVLSSKTPSKTLIVNRDDMQGNVSQMSFNLSFSYWTDKVGTLYNRVSPGYTYTEDAPLDLIAVYDDTTSSITRALMERVFLSKLEQQGFDFVGWFTEPEGGTQITSVHNLVQGMTIYARWQEASLEVNYSSGVLTISGQGPMNEGVLNTIDSYDKSSVTSVVIENGVTDVGHGAFAGFESITSVALPDSVTSIGEGAFSGCTGLTSVTIPNSVTSIGWWAFSGCTGLTSVTIPNSVTSIGNYAFEDCTGLTSITIPNSVTSIGDMAFYRCTGLTSVTIPNSVTSIDYYAFSGCTGLTSVTIPNSVTSIGDRAFEGCTGLTSVTIPDSVTSISYEAFYGCTGLTSVTIPNSVTSIGESAFYDCSGLTSITIPNSVTSIGEAAFYGCTGLTSLTIPNSVTSIGGGAFAYCTSLQSIMVDSNNQKYTSIDGVLFDKSVNTIIQYLAGREGAYSIPNSVTSIGWYAFWGCTGLTSVTIPNSVTSIGEAAFGGCKNLKTIYGQSGSYAESWAKENGCSFVAI